MSGFSGFGVGVVVGGDHRIVERLGEGGMGAVFVATQLSTGKRRALKLMRMALADDPKLRERFLREARVGSKLATDHVVEVVGAGIDEATGTPWLSMELLDGVELGAYADAWAPLRQGEVREIFRQLSHGLGAAHDQGIVHRDLKPENVFLADARRDDVPFTLKILDFGIAKITAEALRETTDTLGSPLWMAPEQAERGRLVSPRTDVWALGLIAFRLLTGRCYWLSALDPEPSSVKIIKEIFLDPLAPASERERVLGSTILPDGFDAWFARCVDRDPDNRFADARAAYAALEPLLELPAEPIVLRALPAKRRRGADTGLASTIAQPGAEGDADRRSASLDEVLDTSTITDAHVRRRRTLLRFLVAACVGAAVIAGGALLYTSTRPRVLASFRAPPAARSTLPAKHLALSRAVVATGAGRLVVLSEDTLYEILPGDRALRLTAGRGDADGPALSARFNHARGVAVGADGAIYVADTGNHRVRVLRGDRVETLAGNGQAGFADGARAAAKFNAPRGIAVDSSGVVHVADSGNNVVRAIRGAEVVTVAGTGRRSSVDGPALEATFDDPATICAMANGDIHLFDGGRLRVVRKGRVDTVSLRPNEVAPPLSVAAMASSADAVYLAEGDRLLAYRDGALEAISPAPGDRVVATSIAVDARGSLHAVDELTDTIRVTDTKGQEVWSTVVGSEPGLADGPLRDARFSMPSGMAFDPRGRLHVADYANGRVRIVGDERVETLGVDFQDPSGVAFGGDGTLYVAARCHVYAVSPSGAKRAVDTGDCNTRTDGLLGEVALGDARDVAVGPDGSVYVVSRDRIKWIHEGRIETFAGGGADSSDVDKPAVTAEFGRLSGIAFGLEGELYIAGAHRVFVMNGETVHVVAGGAEGFTDGPAPLAALSAQGGIAVGPDGALYIGDTENHRVRVLKNGTVSTFAGDGEACVRDGAAQTASFGAIRRVAVDPRGRVFVLDSNRVRVVANGQVSTVAGD